MDKLIYVVLTLGITILFLCILYIRVFLHFRLCLQIASFPFILLSQTSFAYCLNVLGISYELKKKTCIIAGFPLIHLYSSIRKFFWHKGRFCIQRPKPWFRILVCWHVQSVHRRCKFLHDHCSIRYRLAVHLISLLHSRCCAVSLMNVAIQFRMHCKHSWQIQNSPFRL